LQLTKVNLIEDLDTKDIQEDFFLSSDLPNIKTKSVCYVLIQPNYISTAYIDLTGRFPKKSSRGNEYILVGYHHDGNCVLGQPIRDRRGSTIIEAW